MNFHPVPSSFFFFFFFSPAVITVHPFPARKCISAVISRPFSPRKYFPPCNYPSLPVKKMFPCHSFPSRFFSPPSVTIPSRHPAKKLVPAGNYRSVNNIFPRKLYRAFPSRHFPPRSTVCSRQAYVSHRKITRLFPSLPVNKILPLSRPTPSRHNLWARYYRPIPSRLVYRHEEKRPIVGNK